MKTMCDTYARKLVTRGLVLEDDVLVAGTDAELVWNREDPRTAELETAMAEIGAGSLVFARPAEPFCTIMEFLCARSRKSVKPRDTETRTFLHDIPIVREFSAEALARGLSRRKAVLIPGHGIAACGSVMPEQAFVFYSSTCFAVSVLFFSEYLTRMRISALDPEYRAAFWRACAHLPEPRIDLPDLLHGPFESEDQAVAAMTQAGRAVVEYGLVDSFFGNVSCRVDDVIHISQTGSSLDELEGCIDPCPMDGSSCAGLTASSELTAHEDVYRRTPARCILHGHPRFSVIMSMYCDRDDCVNRDACHIHCTEKRFVGDAPVVPGEVGTGPTGLCHTLPPALERHDAAIVLGHGVFATARTDFNDAFRTLLETENASREAYFELVRSFGG
ncbi:class II aldolase/adducin family protein [Pseudodesulfovibrio tunisiensis]|uniref:class II aldolase/adducin family protein n=1 Tax=Pseudodesulfovibrio tunisiensis TaxID=463192 RepID=UPI001FB51FD9|nr:class II aldolase/adducin family protein [Pseudodesulfovibrio tunisiensis]